MQGGGEYRGEMESGKKEGGETSKSTQQSLRRMPRTVGGVVLGRRGKERGGRGRWERRRRRKEERRGEGRYA